MRLILLLLTIQPSGLGSDRFADRERAEQALDRAWPASALLCYNGLKSSDPEIRRRCRAIIDRNPPTWAYHVWAWWVILQHNPPSQLDPRIRGPMWTAFKLLGLYEGAEDDFLEFDDDALIYHMWTRLGRWDHYGG